EFGDAEVEEFGDAIGGDENVAGLEIAMDDQAAMGVRHGFADLAEEFAAGGDADFLAFAIRRDGGAFDVLHDEVGAAVGNSAAIEEFGDVGVVEGGENLTLLAEAADDGVGIHAAFDELDGDALLEGIVIADGEVDGAHAAAADLFENAVGAD